jgi:serine/threonine protein kinase
MSSTLNLLPVRDAGPSNDHRLPTIGQVVDGRYRLDAHLGAGGFATVYRATNLRTNQEVAVKVLIPQKADARTQERFSREVDVVTQLRHPNTVTVFDRGQTEGGLPFLVMELLDGTPLDEWIVSIGRLSPRQLRHVAVQVLRSLVEAHDAHIIHRDIKPANIFVARMPDDDMFIKVLDFGLAKSLDPSASGPKTTNVLCTPAYAPPERLHSNINSVQTDIYAVGMTLVEALQGFHPLAGFSVARIIDFHLLEKKEVQVPPGVMSTQLGSVLKIALARDPAHRFTSARAMLTAFISIDEQTLSESPLPFTTRPAAKAPGSHLLDLTFELVDEGNTLARAADGGTRDTLMAPTSDAKRLAQADAFEVDAVPKPARSSRSMPIALALIVATIIIGILAMRSLFSV